MTNQLKNGYVYIMSNKWRTTFYIGVTNDLMARAGQHQQGNAIGFVKRYQLHDLIYFEHFTDMRHAIMREKQIKNWHREWKINLIKQMNPNLDNLKDKIFGEDAETSSA